MRKGFTLIELLVSMGLMALLATLATTGYYAASRGMADRGARQDVISFLRLAAQRAIIDDVPVAVFVSNRTIQGKGDGTRSAVNVGCLTAVRMGGRISYIGSNGELVDEFADWKTSYPNVSGNNSGNNGQLMSFYKIMAGGSLQSCRCKVLPYAKSVQRHSDEELVFTGVSIGTGKSENKTISIQTPLEQYNAKFTPTTLYGFEVIEKGSVQWHVGDPYGFEIGQLQLPSGYTFKGTISEEAGEEDIAMLTFFPADARSTDEVPAMEGGTIQITAVRPTGRENVGSSISANDLKDSAL